MARGAEITFDESRFLQLWERLSEKNRLAVMRRAYRQSGQKLRREVIRQIRSPQTRLRWDPSMRRSVRLIVFRQTPGFRVTVGTKGRPGAGLTREQFNAGRYAGWHMTSRRDGRYQDREAFLIKPVLIWAEKGTAHRYRNKGKGRTGQMEPGMFMERARDNMTDAIQSELADILMTAIVKQAARNGIW